MATTEETATARPASPTRLFVFPAWATALALYAALFLALFLIQQLSFAAARIPITLTVSPTRMALSADGQTLALSLPVAPSQATFISSNTLNREFQIDGTDSTNNFTVDPDYIISIADSPYFRFQSWMRDSDSYSSWSDLTAQDASTNQPLSPTSTIADSLRIALPPGRTIVLSAAIQRPEAPVQILLLCGQNPCAQIVFDRNDRYIRAQTLDATGAASAQQQVYFPLQPLPFLAEIVYLVAHIALWSLALLGVLAVLHFMLVFAFDRVSRFIPTYPSVASGVGALPAAPSSVGALPATPSSVGALPAAPLSSEGHVPPASRRRVFAVVAARLSRAIARRNRWDLLTALIVVASFIFTCFVALVQYHAQPHILDASAYYFQAKIFASGHLAAPAPTDTAFQGPFMVIQGGRWFAQYPPATSALLALGLLAHLPWIVEPLLGALSLWGIYAIGVRLFSRPVACLAVLLGALSAFYTYLAASYLSHTVALFFGVYFVLLLLRFAEGRRVRDLCLAAACWGGLLLTRELSAAIIGAGATVFIFLIYHRPLLRDRLKSLTAVFAALGVALFAVTLYFLYNRFQTGDAFTSPRALFSPADRYGFGVGIGFYGQHTLAAGLVILDQLLTILQLDLFGWPFYLTLAFIPLAFLGRSTRHTWDWFCLLLFAALTLAQVGYFYHGIYLGPRYLYDTLPFVLLLTARGIANLTAWLAQLARNVPALANSPHAPHAYARTAARVLVGLAVAALLACNLVYYLPRQLALHTNFTGLPAAKPVDVTALYSFHPNNAILVTDDWSVYNYILWPLNDPALSGPTLYAYAPTTADVSRLQREYPTRAIYVVTVAPSGAVSFVPAPH